MPFRLTFMVRSQISSVRSTTVPGMFTAALLQRMCKAPNVSTARRIFSGLQHIRQHDLRALISNYTQVLQTADTQNQNFLWNSALIGVSYNKQLPNAKQLMLELAKYWILHYTEKLK